MSIENVSWHSTDNKICLSLPFAKVDKEKRMVSGFATLDNLDRHGDVVTADASQSAFDKFRGNLREMHQPIAVGKVLSFNTQDFYDAKSNKTFKGVYVDAYISKGAQDTWEKVLDGTLTGFSIGGNIVKASMEPGDDKADESKRVIKEYDLQELSLVDSPANPLANIFSIQKHDGKSIIKGMANDIELENIFWCKNDNIATPNATDEKNCVICNDPMDNIGWVEKNDTEKSIAIKKIVDSYLTKDDAPGPEHGPNNIAMESNSESISTDDTINMYPDQNPIGVTKAGISVGSFVTWGSSGGRAFGKIKKIVTKGKVKIPNSSVSLNASKDNPIAVITVYKKTEKGFEPTDVTVGHKVDTLKPAKNKSTKIKKGGTDMTNDPDETLEVTEVDEIATDFDDTENEEVEIVSEVSAEDLDFTKMITDLKDFFEKALNKNFEAQEELNEKIEDKLEKSADNLKNKIYEVSENYSALLEKNTALEAEITDLKKSLNDALSRINSYESETAIKKSGDVVQATETKIQKSIWQGHFLGVSEL